MTTDIAPFAFTIKFSELAVTPVLFPMVKKDEAVKSVAVSTKRKNRKRGIPPDSKTCGFYISNKTRNVFKKVCRANGKGMSEVINAFMDAYNTKGKDEILKRVLG
jgi:hypothetical protein